MNEIYGHPQETAPRGYQHWREGSTPTDVERAEADFEGDRAPAAAIGRNSAILTPAGETRMSGRGARL